MDWIAPDDLNIPSWVSITREVVVISIRGCGSSGLDWPVVTTGGLRYDNKLKQGLTGTHFQTCVVPPDLQSGDACIYPYGIIVFVFAVSAFVFVILALVA